MCLLLRIFTSSLCDLFSPCFTLQLLDRVHIKQCSFVAWIHVRNRVVPCRYVSKHYFATILQHLLHCWDEVTICDYRRNLSQGKPYYESLKTNELPWSFLEAISRQVSLSD